MLAALLLGALALRHIPGFAHVLDSTERLRQGVSGRLLFIVVGTAWCLFGLPRQVLCFAAGVAYGLAEGTVLSTLVTMTGALGCFAWARWGARGWAARRVMGGTSPLQTHGGLKGRFTRMKRTLQQHPFVAVVTLRLMPVGSSLLLNLFAGLAGVAFLPFAAATLAGSLPQTLIFVLLGTGTHINSTGRLVLAVGLFTASGVLGLWLMRNRAADPFANREESVLPPDDVPQGTV